MKKNKIILLTVLIMLVLYCGAVIFVTKPEGFNISSFFTANSVPKTEPDRSNLKAEIEAEVKSDIKPELKEEIDKEVKVSVDSLESRITDSMNTLLNNLKAELEAEASTEKIVEQVEIDLRALAAELYTAYKEDLVESITPEIVDAVLAQLSAELAEPVVEEVEVTPVETETTETTETTEAEEPVVQSEMSEEEYFTIRESIRNEEINNILSQLN